MRLRPLYFLLALVFVPACRFGFELASEDGGAGGGSLGGQGGAGTGGRDGEGGGSGGSNPACDDWQDPGQSHRRQLTFHNGAATEALSEFTVLVVLTAQNFDYSATAPFGADVRFRDRGTGDVLPHHVDNWNEGSISTLWVQVPRIDASDRDHIWMYYGGEEATAQASSAAYDADYRGVWHLSESSGALVDSTSSAISLNWAGAGVQGTAGRIGLAIEPMDGGGATSAGGEFDGVSDVTITLWARASIASGGDDQQTLIFVGEQTADPQSGPGMYFDALSRQVGTWVDGAYHFSAAPANQLLLDEWAFVALRADASSSGGFVQMKVNGGDFETVYAGDASSVATVSGAAVQVGTRLGPLEADFDGGLDEVQVSEGRRSDDWVDAQYRSQANLGFVTVGAEDTCDD